MGDGFNGLWNCLDALEQQFAEEGLAIKDRPWEAFQKISTIKYSIATGQKNPHAVPLNLAGEDFSSIFKWYAQKYPQIFKSPINPSIPFFHNGVFWPINICMAFGRVNTVPIGDIIHSMPESELKHLERVNIAGYHHFWADCVDYLYGHDDMTKTIPSGVGKDFLIAAEEHLKVAAAALFQVPPQGKMSQLAVMAVEMYLKGFLCINGGFTEDQVKKQYGHEIKRLMDACINIGGSGRLKAVEQIAAQIFPSVNERYTPSGQSSSEMWEIYRVAQFIAAEILRMLTGRDTRGIVEVDFPAYSADEFK